MQQLYVPKETPMNVVVFFSGGASSLRAMLQDSNYGRLYRVTGAYTDKEDAGGRKLCKENKIQDLYISRRDFYRQNGLDPKDWSARKRFYEMLRREIWQFKPDIIALSGYMHIVTDPLLAEYKSRVLNVHPADLTVFNGEDVFRLDSSQLSPAEVRKIVDSKGLSRKFKGEDAVYDAIVAGEPATRSTIHIATEDFDEGPIVVQSKAFIVDQDAIQKPGLREYASSLQDRMKSEGDGPAYLKALELISQGRLTVDSETLFLDGRELPYCGFRLGDTE